MTSMSTGAWRDAYFLPAAVLGSLICGAIVAIAFHIGLSRFAPPGDLWRESFTHTMSYLAFGGSFVFIGSRIAPSHKMTVAIVLTVLALVFSISMIVLLVAYTQTWSGLYKYVAMSAGSGVMAFSASKEHKLPLTD